MPDVKISALPAATVPLAGTEVLPIVQSSTTRQVSVANLTAGRAISASSITNSALTSGRVTYAGASGLLSDSANLVWDNTNARLGIGTTIPYGLLNIKGTNGQLVLANGNTSGGVKIIATDLNYTANGYLAFEGYSSEYGRFDASGNLGIGVTPSAWNTVTGFQIGRASLYGYAANEAGFQNNAFYSTGWKYIANGFASQIQLDSSGNLAFKTAPSGTAGNAISFTQAMTLNTDGQLLLGTTSVFNSAFTMSLKVSGSTGGLIIQPGADSYTAIQFNNAAGSGVGSISVSSTLTSYNVSSDQRLKTNIVDAPSGNIDDIKVRSFDWKSDGSHQEYGMVAQELIEVAPYAVTKPVNSDEMMSVDYSKLVPMMIKEIQSLRQRITALENK